MNKDNIKNKIRTVDNLIFYGDVHIFSKTKIRNIFKKNPDIDCIALELDKRRYKQFEKGSIILPVRILCKVSKKARKTWDGMKGSFEEAIDISKEKNIPIKLIDLVPMPKIGMITTFKALMSVKKDKNFNLNKSVDNLKNIDVNKLGKTEEDILLKKIVLNSKKREQRMVKEILKIKNKYNKILVIIGYGHLDNIIK